MKKALKRLARRVLPILLAVCLTVSCLPLDAFAWKNLGHVTSANLTLLELLRSNNGQVTIYAPYGSNNAYTYTVPQEYRDAIMTYPDAFRAGSMGPDFFPDMMTGQGFIHPYDKDHKMGSGEWISLLCKSVNMLPKDSAQRKRALAFTLGFMLHYCGDMFGHDFINQFSGGTYPELTKVNYLNTKDRNLNIILGHMSEETYMDSKVNWDFYNRCGLLNISAPIQFVSDTLLYDGTKNNGAADIYEDYGGVPAIYVYLISLRTHLFNAAEDLRTSCDPIKAAAVKYLDRWIEDLDNAADGLVQCFNNMANRMVTNKKPDMIDIVTEELMSWKDNYGKYITPVPDIFIDLAAEAQKLVDTVKAQFTFIADIDAWIKEQIKSLAMTCMGIAGLDKKIEEYSTRMNDPSVQLDSADNPFMSGNRGNNFSEYDTFMAAFASEQSALTNKSYSDIINGNDGGALDRAINSEFPAFYNTLVMFKLILIGPDNFSDFISRVSGVNQNDYQKNTAELYASSLSLYIRTADKPDAGTDDNIFAMVYDGNTLIKKKLLDKSGHDDFERGKSDTYTVELGYPVKLSNINVKIKKESTNTGSPDWDCESITITPYHVGAALTQPIGCGGRYDMENGQTWDLYFHDELMLRSQAYDKWGALSANVRIVTSKEGSGGTDDEVTLEVYNNGRYVKSIVLDKADYNDFEGGDDDTYTVPLASNIRESFPIENLNLKLRCYGSTAGGAWTVGSVDIVLYHGEIQLTNTISRGSYTLDDSTWDLNITGDIKRKLQSFTPFSLSYTTYVDDGMLDYMYSLDDSHQYLNSNSLLWGNTTVRREVFFKIFKGFGPDIKTSDEQKKITQGTAFDMDFTLEGMWNGVRASRRNEVYYNPDLTPGNGDDYPTMPAVNGSATISFLNSNGGVVCSTNQTVSNGKIQLRGYKNSSLNVGTYSIKVTYSPDSGNPLYASSEKVFSNKLKVTDGATYYYIDYDGSTKYIDDYTVLDGTETEIEPGWYVVNSNITYNSGLKVGYDKNSNSYGTVYFLLCDGATMNVGTSANPINGTGMYCYSSAWSGWVAFYGQSNGTGALNIYSTSYGIYSRTGVGLNGGNVSICSSNDGIRTDGTVYINRGKVYGRTTGGDAIISGGSTFIGGGNTDVSGTSKGIRANGGYDLNFSWTSPSDRITSNSYYAKNESNYKFNKSFIIDDNGTLANSSNISGKTLIPAYKVTFINGNDVYAEKGASAETGIVAKPADPTKNDYIFCGWSDGSKTYGPNEALPKLTADTTFTAVFEKAPRIVGFADNNITANKTQANEGELVILGYNAAFPENKTIVYTVTKNGTNPAQTVDVTDGKFIMPNCNVTVSASLVSCGEHFTKDGDTYTVNDSEGWDIFCDYLANSAYDGFSGKTVKLGNDITVTRTAALLLDNAFKGTFDGQGKTITANINNTNFEAAVFSKINGAVIKNLNVAGSITGGRHSSAIVAVAYDTDNVIDNCTATANVTGDDYIGGILGHGTSCDISVTNCVFAGKLTGVKDQTASPTIGVFFGWGDKGGNKSITNCLYIADEDQNLTGLDLVRADRNYASAIEVNNCYKTTTAGNLGKTASKATAGENVAIGLADGCTAGVVYNNSIYAAQDETLDITLEYIGEIPAGMSFEGFAASTGTLEKTDNGYTLTMLAQDMDISADVIISVPFGAPELTATAGDRSVTLQWQPVYSAIKYAVSIIDGETETVLSNKITAASYTVKDLEADKEYTFFVKAYNGRKWSSASEISVTPYSLIPKPEATVAGNTATITWHEIPGAVKYAVSIIDGETTTVLSNKVLAASYTVKDLEPGKTYGFTVQAYANKKWHEASEEISVTTKNAPIVTAKAGEGSITLTWNELPGMTKYAVLVVEGETMTVISNKITETTYKVTNLTPGETYTFVVMGFNGKTWADESDEVSATVKVPPIAAPEVTIAAGDRSALLTWNEVPGAVKYAVLFADGETRTLISNKISAAEYAVKNLTAGENYTFVVKAFDGRKWSAESTEVSTVPYSAIPVVEAVAGDGRITLKWEAVPGATKYAVKLIDGETKTIISNKITSTKLVLSGLENGRTYTYTVQAYNGKKWSAASEEVSAVPTAPAVFGAPQEVKATAGDRSVTLTWNEVLGAVKYAVSLIDGETKTIISNKITSTKLVLSGLENGRTYTYVVQAYNGKKWSAASEKVSAVPYQMQ